MIDRLYFPQPQNLEDRYYNIQRQYVERNPSGFGYARGTKLKQAEQETDDLDVFIKFYRRQYPNVKRETAIREAVKLFEKSKRHPDIQYYNPNAWEYEAPHILE